jgi:hypothetical protein
MTDLQHPETGAHTRASRATADVLIEQGWEEVGGKTSASDAATPPKRTKSEDGKKKSEPPAAPPKTDSAPQLDKMKLTELIAHAEAIGIPAEQIEPLRKPGASKKQAIEITTAHAAA